VLISIALLIFFSGRRHYHRTPPQGSVVPDLLRCMRVANAEGVEQRGRSRWFPVPRYDDLNLAAGIKGVTRDAVVNTRSLYRVLPIYCVLPVFWMLFEQQTNTWTFQAKAMNTSGAAPETLGVFNPIFIMILIPFFDRVVYPTIARTGYNFTPLRRMGFGMIFAALSFFMFAGLQYKMDHEEEESLSMFWQLPQIFTISVAEILVSVTGLEFSYEQATPVLKSLLTALFLITSAVGTSIAGALFDSVAPHLTALQVALLFAFLMLANWLVFLFVAMRFRPAEPGELSGTEQSTPDTTIDDTKKVPVDVEMTGRETRPESKPGAETDGGEMTHQP